MDVIKRSARRSDAQWLALFEAQSTSAETQEQFCKSRGIGVSTFCKAKQRLGGGRHVARVAQADFVAVDVDAGPVSVWSVELSLGDGVVLRVRRD